MDALHRPLYNEMMFISKLDDKRPEIKELEEEVNELSKVDDEQRETIKQLNREIERLTHELKQAKEQLKEKSIDARLDRIERILEIK